LASPRKNMFHMILVNFRFRNGFACVAILEATTTSSGTWGSRGGTCCNNQKPKSDFVVSGIFNALRFQTLTWVFFLGFRPRIPRFARQGYDSVVGNLVGGWPNRSYHATFLFYGSICLHRLWGRSWNSRCPRLVTSIYGLDFRCSVVAAFALVCEHVVWMLRPGSHGFDVGWFPKPGQALGR
jgi:hypothetical protein